MNAGKSEIILLFGEVSRKIAIAPAPLLPPPLGTCPDSLQRCIKICRKNTGSESDARLLPDPGRSRACSYICLVVSFIAHEDMP